MGFIWNEVVKLMAYIAHKTEDNREQPLIDHLKGTAELCRSFAIDDLKDYAYFCGLIHDIGKYSNAFQEKYKSRARTERSARNSQAAYANVELYA